jgi:uncharacterized protein YukE
MGFLTAVAKLFGRDRLTDEDIKEILTDHQGRIEDQAKRLDDVEQRMNGMVEKLAKELETAGRRSGAAKKQATDDLQAVKADLDRLISVVQMVLEGEKAPARQDQIKRLLKAAKSNRTRVTNEVSARLQ